MKKIIVLFCLCLIIGGCNSKDSLRFKDDYESLNGKVNSNGKGYRVINIDKNNPFIYSDIDSINKKIENGDSFIVYFGANWCPWCRSILESVIKVSRETNIKKIYYIDVRKDNNIDNDIRDIYDKNDNGEVYLSHKGVDGYYKFLKYADNVLKDYDSHGVKVDGVKRVGAPNYIMFKNGKAVKLITGIPNGMNDPYMDISKNMYKEIDKIFRDFFKEYDM